MKVSSGMCLILCDRGSGRLAYGSRTLECQECKKFVHVGTGRYKNTDARCLSKGCVVSFKTSDPTVWKAKFYHDSCMSSSRRQTDPLTMCIRNSSSSPCGVFFCVDTHVCVAKPGEEDWPITNQNDGWNLRSDGDNGDGFRGKITVGSQQI